MQQQRLGGLAVVGKWGVERVIYNQCPSLAVIRFNLAVDKAKTPRVCWTRASGQTPLQKPLAITVHIIWSDILAFFSCVEEVGGTHKNTHTNTNSN